jgi:hypothetical protein
MNPDLWPTEAWQKSSDTVKQGCQTIRICIETALHENRGALIGRHGTIELTCALLMDKGYQVDEERLKTLERNAGIFPTDYVQIWATEYSVAAALADCMAVGWYAPLARSEIKYVQRLNPFSLKIPLRSLEPYYCPQASWLQALQGQHVCVVSSFADTIQKQITKLKDIWKDQSFFPDGIQWSLERSYYSPPLAKGSCGWPKWVASWKDAVDMMEEDVMATSAKIVLIGCGGLAMPLAARLKKRGKICIVLGGAIQILFGIKGKRWERHPIISQLFNEHWVYPADEEVPDGAREVEGGCYW